MIGKNGEMNINGRLIGNGAPCYIIAEMSANHGGSLERAIDIIRAAKASGADAVKLQTYTPDTMTINCDNKYFCVEHPLWTGKTLYQLYQEAYTPWEWHRPLKEEADRLGLHFFSTPFDETAVDFLEDLEVPAYKIASFELVDDALLKKVARTHKPVIMSTGMATMEEISRAVDILRSHGTSQLALLRCVSAYPARPQEMNLRMIGDLAKRFGVVVGLSDHTLGNLAAVAGVAMGAEILEKHLKFSDGDATIDAAFSLSPANFHQMIHDIRRTESSLGKVVYGPTGDEQDSLKFRRSIFVVKDMALGDIFSLENLRIIRPGYGLSPVFLKDVLGKKAASSLCRGTPLTAEMVAGIRSFKTDSLLSCFFRFFHNLIVGISALWDRFFGLFSQIRKKRDE